MSRSKEVTYEKAKSMLQRAVEGSRRLGLDDVADEYEEMSVEDYADRKGLVLTNPAPVLPATPIQKRSKTMANDPRTKDQILEDEEKAVSTGDDTWNELVDLDEDSSKEDLLNSIENVLEMWNEFDPERFPMDDDDEEQEQDKAA
jgi:hypothetical protein